MSGFQMASLDHFINKSHKKYFIRDKTVRLEVKKTSVRILNGKNKMAAKTRWPTIQNPDKKVRFSNGLN
jgi:hypothetical protein